MPPLTASIPSVQSILESFVTDILLAVPKLVTGAIFLALAYVGIRIITSLLRRTLDRIYPESQALVVDLLVLVAKIFLWFGAGLTLLDLVGMGQIAASLGTAAGFIALGVSYALSNMIADTVAGIYLLRDPDFNPGDTVTTESVTGVVESIGLRKSRLRLDDGDLIILANRNVESKWTWQASSE